jgi:hypothetical protein
MRDPAGSVSQFTSWLELYAAHPVGPVLETALLMKLSAAALPAPKAVSPAKRCERSTRAVKTCGSWFVSGGTKDGKRPESIPDQRAPLNFGPVIATWSAMGIVVVGEMTTQ